MQKLRKLRKKQGLPLRKLAKEVKISPGMLSLIETGRRLPSLAVLFRICVFFGVQPWDLLDPLPLPNGCSDMPDPENDILPLTWGTLQ